MWPTAAFSCACAAGACLLLRASPTQPAQNRRPSAVERKDQVGSNHRMAQQAAVLAGGVALSSLCAPSPRLGFVTVRLCPAARCPCDRLLATSCRCGCRPAKHMGAHRSALSSGHASQTTQRQTTATNRMPRTRAHGAPPLTRQIQLVLTHQLPPSPSDIKSRTPQPTPRPCCPSRCGGRCSAPCLPARGCSVSLRRCSASANPLPSSHSLLRHNGMRAGRHAVSTVHSSSKTRWSSVSRTERTTQEHMRAGMRRR
jgi:hypothetical protein